MIEVKHVIERHTPVLPQWRECEYPETEAQMIERVKELRDRYRDCMFRGVRVTREVIHVPFDEQSK